jgi:uncharacterized protein (UPF0254 family)
MQQRFKDFATANANGFMGDDVHPSAAGYEDEAAFLASILCAA